MSRLRVAIVADYLEEGWPSMDLIAEMLLDRLQREHSGTIDATLIRPSFRRRAGRMPGLRRNATAHGLDRIANRMYDYPRELAKARDRFDVFHLVDHSYSQLGTRAARRADPGDVPRSRYVPMLVERWRRAAIAAVSSDDPPDSRRSAEGRARRV